MKSDPKNAAAIETWITDHATASVTGQEVLPGDTGTATTELDGFKSSPGNTVNIKPIKDGTGAAIPGTYCIDVKNDSSSEPTKFVVYNSNAGGLQSGFTTACV